MTILATRRPGSEPALFDALLEGVHEAVLVLDDGARIIDANAAAGRLFGAAPERLVSRSLIDVAPALAGDPAEGDAELVLASGDAVPVRYRRSTAAAGVVLLAISRLGADRLARLHAAAATLAGELTSDDIARQALARGVPAAGAIAGTVQLLAADGLALELLAHHGMEPDHAGSFTRVPLLDLQPGTDALRGAAPVFVESLADLAQRYPHLTEAATRRPRRAWACLPLVTGGRAIGVMSLCWTEPRRFSGAERAALAQLAHAAAAALDRARLYEREREARHDAEGDRERLQLLVQASSVLSSSLDWEVTVQAAARLALGGFADWCVVDVLEEGDRLRRVAVAHADPARAEAARELQGLAPEPGSFSWPAFETGRPHLCTHVDEARLAALPGDGRRARLARALGVASYVAAPLTARGRTIGVFAAFRGPSGRTCDADDVVTAEDLARRVALAVDNARLMQESRKRAALLEDLDQVARRVAEAGPDLDQVLDVTVRSVAEKVGDLAAIRLRADDGVGLDLAAAHHVDAEALAAARAAMEKVRRADEGLTGRVFATGQPIFFADVPPAELGAGLREEYRAYVARFGTHALAILPLSARGRVIGALVCARDRSARGYTGEDRAFMEQVADRAAVAIDNARLHRAVRAAENRLAGIVSSAMDAIITVDAAQRIVLWNAAAEKLFRCPAEDAVGAPLGRFLPERYGDPISGLRQGSLMAVRAGGEEFPIEATLSELETEGQRLHTIILRDVTDRARALAQREEDYRLRELLLGVLGHDLRNPIGVVGLSAYHLLKRGRLDEQQGRSLARIATAAERMQRMVDQLLDFTRIRHAGGIPIDPGPVDLREVTARIADEFESIHPGRPLTCAATGDATGRWDGDRLAQVISNLVGNAIEHGRKDGPVAVTIRDEGETVVLEVRNEGLPIPPELRSVVFDPFRRAGVRPEMRRKSLGLGLYIAREVVIAHGGAIELRSSDEEGTTFSVRLPREPPAGALRATTS